MKSLDIFCWEHEKCPDSHYKISVLDYIFESISSILNKYHIHICMYIMGRRIIQKISISKNTYMYLYFQIIPFKSILLLFLNFLKVVLSNNVLLDLFYHLFFLRLSLDRKLFDFLWFCKKTCQGRDKIILKVALLLVYTILCLSCFYFRKIYIYLIFP